MQRLFRERELLGAGAAIGRAREARAARFREGAELMTPFINALSASALTGWQSPGRRSSADTCPAADHRHCAWRFAWSLPHLVIGVRRAVALSTFGAESPSPGYYRQSILTANWGRAPAMLRLFRWNQGQGEPSSPAVAHPRSGNSRQGCCLGWGVDLNWAGHRLSRRPDWYRGPSVTPGYQRCAGYLPGVLSRLHDIVDDTNSVRVFFAGRRSKRHRGRDHG